MATEEQFTHIVVVGASAGGIDALRTLMTTLPPDLPAPIVIAQHLDPHRVSNLNDILTRAGPLAVRTVNGRETLRRGTVYVVPPNHDVEITDGSITVRRGDRTAPLPSIDRLFRTAASVYEENTIAVVLSGTGNDGAAGALDVKAAGGTVIIQNPETASFLAMPLALSPTTVDIVADLQTLGALLADLLSGNFPLQAPEEESQLRGLLEQLRERSGVDFSAYKSSTITRRLHRRMVAAGTANLGEYVRYLQRNPDEYQRLVNSFLIKVTEFFRDPELFDELRERILPALIDDGQTGSELRIWSAGCATGEEAYSLAILISDLLAARNDSRTVRIFATDIDAEAVAFARQGVYSTASVSTLPPEVVERHFTRADGAFEVRKHIRGMVVFGQHDLGQRSPFPRIDLILCRNVLIYFTTELQKRALQLFAFSLRDRGYLVLGKAETVSPLPEYFALEHPRLKVYRRIGDRVLIPTARIRSGTPFPAPRPTVDRAGGLDLTAMRGGRPLPPIHTASERAEGVLLRMPVGIVVVNRQYDIQMINSAARRLLRIHSSAIGDDLIHLVQRVPLMTLRNAIDGAFRGEPSTLTFQVDNDEQAPNERLDIQLQVYAETAPSAERATDAVVLIVSDVSGFVEREREAGRQRDELAAELARVTDQAQRLTESNRVLLTANEELTTINAELRSSNEEMLIVNEEIQAATEEVETLNEELQASNEELETLNEELQATVEELNTTNDDLQARSVELQDMTISLEAQRRQSEAQRDRTRAILDNLGGAVLVVDQAGEPTMTNAAFRSMFGDDGASFQPEDDAGRVLSGDDMLQARVARGETFRAEFSMDGGSGNRRWFEAIGQPVAIEDAASQGVIVIRDITDRSLRRMQNEFLALASHELRSPLTALSGNVQMLKRTLGDRLDARAARYIDSTQEQTRQLAALIEDLVDAVRLQTGRFRLDRQQTDLNELVQQVVDAVRPATTGQTITVERSEGDVTALVDRTRIEQVLMNLLRNATTHAAESERVDVRVRRDGGDIVIQVRDYGPGIESANLSNIFSRFFQVQQPVELQSTNSGLGLGLFISREIVEAHGGALSVESELGNGATFVVRLPAS